MRLLKNENKLLTFDNYLSTLNASAAVHVARLAQEAPEYVVRQEAEKVLDHFDWYWGEDFRSWNYAKDQAQNAIFYD